jgi:hypothetical protein
VHQLDQRSAIGPTEEGTLSAISVLVSAEKQFRVIELLLLLCCTEPSRNSFARLILLLLLLLFPTLTPCCTSNAATIYVFTFLMSIVRRHTGRCCRRHAKRAPCTPYLRNATSPRHYIEVMTAIGVRIILDRRSVGCAHITTPLIPRHVIPNLVSTERMRLQQRNFRHVLWRTGCKTQSRRFSTKVTDSHSARYVL